MTKNEETECFEGNCKGLEMEHAWKQVENNIVLASYPPQYPDAADICLNCGMKRIHRSETRKWFEYRLPPQNDK